MTTYRLHADALLRLASMAADNPAADPDAILAIVRSAEVDGDAALPQVGDGPQVGDDSDKPAKPE
ncbi:hypothetical protein [Methylobacterium komagatae]